MIHIVKRYKRGEIPIVELSDGTFLMVQYFFGIGDAETCAYLCDKDGNRPSMYHYVSNVFGHDSKAAFNRAVDNLNKKAARS